MITIEWYWIIILIVITEVLTLFGISVSLSGTRADLETKNLLLKKELEDLKSRHKKATSLNQSKNENSVETVAIVIRKIAVGDYSLAVDPDRKSVV